MLETLHHDVSVLLARLNTSAATTVDLGPARINYAAGYQDGWHFFIAEDEGREYVCWCKDFGPSKPFKVADVDRKRTDMAGCISYGFVVDYHYVNLSFLDGGGVTCNMPGRQPMHRFAPDSFQYSWFDGQLFLQPRLAMLPLGTYQDLVRGLGRLADLLFELSRLYDDVSVGRAFRLGRSLFNGIYEHQTMMLGPERLWVEVDANLLHALELHVGTLLRECLRTDVSPAIIFGDGFSRELSTLNSLFAEMQRRSMQRKLG